MRAITLGFTEAHIYASRVPKGPTYNRSRRRVGVWNVL